jgi:hypothetical protein
MARAAEFNRAREMDGQALSGRTAMHTLHGVTMTGCGCGRWNLARAESVNSLFNLHFAIALATARSMAPSPRLICMVLSLFVKGFPR